MSKSTLLFCIILCLAGKSSQAQTGPDKIDSLLIGTWNGSSICQIKASSCHDETVVYHISKNSGDDTFYINASRMANGVEVGMGILPFVYNKETKQLTSSAHGIWTFCISGAKLEGTLMLHGDLFRKIIVYKHY